MLHRSFEWQRRYAMTYHEHYEILCTLAATGQLDALEKTDFDAHRMQCTACCDRLQDLNSIGAQLQLNAALQATSTWMPTGSLERFRTRAIREGIAPCSVPATAFVSYARASAAALFVIVASLVFILHARRVAERSLMSNGVPIASRQSLTAGVDRRTLIPRPSKVVRAHFVRHGRLRLTDAGARDTSLITQRFSQMIEARYPYFGPQIAMKITVPQYPALSGSQVSRLDLFRTLGESPPRADLGQAPDARPIDIASTGKVFDFAAQIRQLHFQLPIAQ